nr:hypothetical protein [Tanacetum cinerariifolium]
MKLTKELANPRCLSYTICNLTVFSLGTRARQHVLAFGRLRQEGMEMRLRDEGGGDGGGGGDEVFGGGVFGGSVVFSGDGEVDVVRRRSAMGEVSMLSSKNWYGVVKLESWSQKERQFCQCDITRNDDLVSVRVKEPISTMIVRVPKKDRWCGTRGKCFDPISERKTSLKEERTYYVTHSMNHAFRFTILLRCEERVMGEKEEDYEKIDIRL